MFRCLSAAGSRRDLFFCLNIQQDFVLVVEINKHMPTAGQAPKQQLVGQRLAQRILNQTLENIGLLLL